MPKLLQTCPLRRATDGDNRNQWFPATDLASFPCNFVFLPFSQRVVDPFWCWHYRSWWRLCRCPFQINFLAQFFSDIFNPVEFPPRTIWVIGGHDPVNLKYSNSVERLDIDDEYEWRWETVDNFPFGAALDVIQCPMPASLMCKSHGSENDRVTRKTRRGRKTKWAVEVRWGGRHEDLTKFDPAFLQTLMWERRVDIRMCFSRCYQGAICISHCDGYDIYRIVLMAIKKYYFSYGCW